MPTYKHLIEINRKHITFYFHKRPPNSIPLNTLNGTDDLEKKTNNTTKKERNVKERKQGQLVSSFFFLLLFVHRLIITKYSRRWRWWQSQQQQQFETSLDKKITFLFSVTFKTLARLRHIALQSLFRITSNHVIISRYW